MSLIPDITLEDIMKIIHCMDEVEDVGDLDGFILTNGCIVQGFLDDIKPDL